MFMMPVVGQLVSRVDPRMLIAFGFIVDGDGAVSHDDHQLQIDFRTAAHVSRVSDASAWPFLFIPISTLAYLGIPRHKSNQVAGMNNFMRNLGGSIGISHAEHFPAAARAEASGDLSAHASAGDPQFTQQVAGLTQTFTSQGVPPNEASPQRRIR